MSVPSGVSTLRDCVHVGARFHRSVNLVFDRDTDAGSSSYIVTPTAYALALRVVAGLTHEDQPTAWSIAGPYGTGKSAFALFLSRLLSGDAGPNTVQVKGQIETELGLSRWPRSLIVPVVGQRASLERSLLDGLARAIRPYDKKAAKSWATMSKRVSLGAEPVAVAYEQATVIAQRAGYVGVVLLLDEFGKFLEYAALHSEEGDLYVMQLLAEFSARSSPAPFSLITLLHSGFADYLVGADSTRREEWTKVQGRFTDVAFLEPLEQQLALLGTAIECEWDERTRLAYERAIDRVVGHPVFDEARRRVEAVPNLLRGIAPIEPTVGLVLGPLSRSKLAQHERTLFAFLTSSEPFGFNDFLSRATTNAESPQFFRLSDLYDYVVHSLGAATYADDRARYWSEIVHGLERIHGDAPELSTEIVKSIGLLTQYGAAAGVGASAEALSLALTGTADDPRVSRAVTWLEQRSVIVFRRHEAAYALWQGSDIDLDARHAEGLERVSRTGVAELVRSLTTLRPFVAQEHYFQSGTLRYLHVEVVEGELRKTLVAPLDGADGRISVVLPGPTDDRATLVASALELTGEEGEGADGLRIFAFPAPVAGLERAAREAAAWGWVEKNTPELLGDRVAKREVTARRDAANAALERILGGLLGLRGHRFEPGNLHWVWRGEMRDDLVGVASFNRWLSGLCADLFSCTPTLHNEILNRSRLSSAGARARRSLIQAMLDHEGDSRLGIVGHPPEYSMFVSLLRRARFYRRRTRSRTWSIGAPVGDWEPVWAEVQAFLGSTSSGRRRVSDLLAALARPPYGLREGPAPIVLVAALIEARESIALYEDGVLVPELRIEALERMLRAPQSFEVQRYALSAPRQSDLNEIAAVIPEARESLNGSEAHLIAVVRRLVLYAAQLPRFSRSTRRLSEAARGVRDALLKATDPYVLLFEELPAVLQGHDGMAQRLSDALGELHRAYPELLDEIERHLRDAFGLTGSSENARRSLARRAEAISRVVPSGDLGLFAREAARVDERDWREVLGRVLRAGIPPTEWQDRHVAAFTLKLNEIELDFVRAEQLVLARGNEIGAQVFQVGILDGNVDGGVASVAVTDDVRRVATALADRLRDAIADQVDATAADSTLARKAVVVALAELAMPYLREQALVPTPLKESR